MSGTIEDSINLAGFIDDIKSLEDAVVNVGLVGSVDSDLLQYAAANEFGAKIKVTDKMRGFLHYMGIHLKKDTEYIVIPERSFLRATFDREDVLNRIQQEFENGLDELVAGTATVDQILNRVGLRGVAEVKKRIVDQNPAFVPLSDITVERKGNDAPLRSSGRMFNAIGYEVKK